MSKFQVLEKSKLFDDGVCPICYSAPQVDRTVPPCGHVCCYNCLKEWSNKSKYRATCPVCSSAFSEIVHNNRKESISPTLIPDAAQVLWLISYMEGTPFWFFSWIVMLCATRGLDVSETGIVEISFNFFYLYGNRLQRPWIPSCADLRISSKKP